MITLIWKELRENFKWALLAALGLGAAEVYGLYPHTQQEEDFGYYEGVTLCKPAFLTVTTFGCAGIGFVLGLLQILPELKRDRWAALLHRPVSRGTIFRGKVVAGLILYLLATLPPFLYSVWLVATPGHFNAPFVPDMVLPGTADLCMGVAYYFAGLATALQRGGWFGLRALPILAAIYTSGFVLAQQFFYVSIEASVLMALALFTAAWGQIHGQDSFRDRPWLGKLAFLAVVFYGICSFTGNSQTFLNAFNPPDYSTFQRYELTDAGMPLRLTYSRSGVTLSVLDLNGNPLSDPRYKPDRVRNHLDYLNTLCNYIGDSHHWLPRVYPSTYREQRSFFWANNRTFDSDPEQWFYLVKQRYWVGYHTNEKRPFTILDQQGFRLASVIPKPFSPQVQMHNSGEGNYCFWEASSIHFAYLYEKKIVEIALPGPGPIYGVCYGWGRTPHGNSEINGVALDSGIAIYDKNAALVTYLPYHYDTARWGQISLSTNGALDRFYIWYQPSPFLSREEKQTMPQYVEEVDLKGRPVHVYTMPPLPPDPPRLRNWQGFLNPRLQTPAFYFGTMVYQEIGGWLGSDRLEKTLAGQFKPDNIATLEEMCLYITGFSLVFAAVALVWGRRRHFSSKRAWAWAAFVFAFGLPGFITFAVTADWPRLVACPSCARRRPIDTASCPHCDAGWPAPPVTGIEIFDPSRAEALAGTSV